MFSKLRLGWLAVKGLTLNYYFKAKAKVKDFFAKKRPKKQVFHSRITYKEWKPGRNDYYEIVDMVRPYNDLNFSENELREHYTYLTSKLFLPSPEGDKIAAELHEAYQCLVDPHKRMMYNIRMDLGDPKINPKAQRVDLILQGVQVILTGVLIWILV